MSRHASVNRSYSLVWNDKFQAYVPAPEGTRARSKRGGRHIVAAVVAWAFASAGYAADSGTLPTGGRVTLGSATIQQNGAQLDIQQSSAKAAIDWQSFSIGASGTVNFRQPSSAAVALNRVVGQDPTQIFGALNANGQVFIVNPNGVFFAPGAQVSAAGVIASTRNLSNDDFAAGRYRFEGSGVGKVVNQGSLKAGEGGYVALIGAQVSNVGRIDAPRGDVRLAAADRVTVTLDRGGLTGFTVERGTLDALAANHGLIRADGGRVYLTADGVDALAKAVINNTGVVEARTVDNHAGVIRLLGDAQTGQVQISGTLDVSAAHGQGGDVVVTAHDVALHDGAVVDASGGQGGGTVLIGGGWQGRDASVAHASTVTVAPTAHVDVSARQQGDGGTAVLWSNDHTGFFGQIAARGGEAGGNGGKVETSSHDSLQLLGTVDASAARGQAGNWLLDPRNVVIAASGASGTAYNASYSPTADSVILASSIVGSLNGGTNVTITTGSTGTSDGNITVNAPIAVTGYYSPTLTLSAANDIVVNAAITNDASTTTRLNVVFTADSDNSGAGGIAFSSTGRVATTGGNFYAGAMSGDTVLRRGQGLTMAAGSSIDVNSIYYGAALDLYVNGAVSLASGSLNNTSNGNAYLNSGNLSLLGSYINVRGAAISSSNTAPAVADIVSRVGTLLAADTIGAAANPIKISGGSSNGSATLTLNNTAGDSYVNQVTRKAFGSISVNIGSQVNSTQSLQIMGDAGGDGHSGTGHILMQTDNGGVLNLVAGDIKTAGIGGATPVTVTNVSISSTNMTFADASVNTGTGSFTAGASAMYSAAPANNVGDISSPSITLNGLSIGSSSNAVEIVNGANAQGSLTIVNSGGSTFVKSVDDKFTTVSMAHVKDAGTHAVLFSGGDHIDFATDGTAIALPTIGGGASDGSTFGATSGIDVTRRNRNVTLSANTGSVVFDDDSVNTGSGSFSTNIARFNATGVIAALNTYNAGNPVAQITAGNVSFSALNDLTPSVTTIGAGGQDIQVAQGIGAANNTLSVSTQQGSVAIHELSVNHFKAVNVSLGSASAAQTIAIDLNGPDDIAFSDSGSLVTVDATKVDVTANNRNFSLYGGARNIRTDGNAPTTGSYALTSGLLLSINSDIVTDGGAISLTGIGGVNLLQSVLLDSNSDRTGASGNISVDASSSSISSTGGSRSLTANSSSTSQAAGSITIGSSANNRAGAYLSSMALNASGNAYATDGAITIAGSSYLINGDFSSAGRTTLSNNNSLTIDTNQANTGSSGSITFSGRDLSSNTYYGMSTFDTSTTQAGANGGNVSLATQNLGGAALSLAGISVNAAGGSGGQRGDITVPAVSTSFQYGGPVTQSYVGRTVTLNGNLKSQNGNITLNGDVRLASSVTIDTNATQAGASGSVAFTGAGVSAASTGRNLTIDTTSADSSGGAVSLPAATAAGGAYVNGLNVNTSGNGSHGALSLTNVNTEGSQTYVGGTATLAVGLTTNGGNVSLGGLSGLTLSGAIAIDTDRVGGSNAAGTLSLGSLALNGNSTLTIDTTADGGGANATLALNGVGNTTAFSSINVAAGSLTVGALNRASGDITMEARGAAADLTLNGTVQTTSGTIVLAAGRNFINNRPGDTGIVAGSGRYLVYSANPATSLEAMTGYGKHYNETYSAGSTPSYAAGSGNWFLYSVAPVISVTSGVTSITYGSADPTLSLGAGNYSGFIDGDTLSNFSGSQSLTLATAGTLSGAGFRQVGSHAVTLNGTLTDNLGYQYAAFNENLNVVARNLALSGITASNKTYDASTAAPLTGTASVMALSGDAVTVDAGAAAGAFANANAGNGKAVTVSGYGVVGADAGNYVVVQPTGIAADITAKALSVAGSTVSTKTYDGSTAGAVTAGTLAGLVGTETVTATAAGVYADKNVGTGKAVAASYTLGNGTNGGLAANYSLAGETLTGDIAQKAVTVAATSANRAYDGTTAATATLTGSGIVSGDAVSFSGTAAFGDKNAGVGKAVMVTGIGALGSDAGNYSYNATAAATADVTPKAITVTATGVDKVYDGTTVMAANLAGTGIVSGDVVSFIGASSMADKNVGTGKAVGVTGIGASGTDAGNYSYNTTAATTADVTPKAVTVTATGVDKVYDGTTAMAANLAGTGIVSGDVVSFSGTGSMADKNAGIGKAVTVAGIGVAGTDAGNYSHNTTAATTANVTPKTITVTATGVDKVYDGTTAMAANLAGTGVVSGDVVSFSGTGSMADKNVGTGKAVGVAGIGASGVDAANYSYNTTASTTANVTTRAITVTAAGVDKVYDGTTDAAALLASAGVVGGDTVSFSGTASLADKNVGTNKAVSVAGIGAAGTDAGNYSYNTTAATTADVTPKAITVTATGVDKVYDGTTAMAANLAGTGIVSGDVVSFSGTGSMADKNAGTGKAVGVAGIGASGADAGNYSYNTTAATTADVTPKAVTVSATGVDKVYDGTTAMAANLAGAGVVSGDVVSFIGAGSMADKNVGTGKAVNVTSIAAAGADAGNYSFNTTAATTATVTTKTITVTATGIGKVYDGSTAATAAMSSEDVVSGDAVTFAGAAAFVNKNAGSGKAVTVVGIGATGADAGNYALASTQAATTADIAQKAIVVYATGVDKVYDGSTTAAALLAGGGIVSGDTVSFSGTASLADKNVGTGKAVGVTAIGASGVDAGNYSFNTTAATVASVTPKAITVTAAGVDKVYDGSAGATAVLTSAGVVGDDRVSFHGNASLADKNVGIGKAVNVTSIAAAGSDAGNYSVNTTGATTANVTPKPITVTGTGVDKVYDGSTHAEVALGSTGWVAGDSLAFTGQGTLADKNAGVGKVVNVSGIQASGADVGNYVLDNATAVTTANVARKEIVVVSAGSSKVYDGTLTVAVVATSDGVVAGDQLAFSAEGRLTDKNVGAGKAVDVMGIAADGADAGNYAFASTGSSTADVTPRALTVALQGSVAKVDDGNATATLQSGNYAVSGVVNGESITVVQTKGLFEDTTLGKDKLVSVTLGAIDYQAAASTLLSNYGLVEGTVSGHVGEIRDAVSTSQAYIGAVNSAASAVSLAPDAAGAVAVEPGSFGRSGFASVAGFAAAANAASPDANGETVATGAGDGEGSPAAQGTTRISEASVVGTNTRENLALRRTFSIDDGGMRLPAGVKGSSKDASE